MKNHNEEKSEYTFIPAVVLLVVLNCVVWSLVFRSVPLIIIGAVVSIVYFIR